MILFKIIGVFWLSICSMFSYGSNESSYSEEYKELDVQESTLNSKGAFVGTIGGRGGTYAMSIIELLPTFEKVRQLSLQIDNARFSNGLSRESTLETYSNSADTYNQNRSYSQHLYFGNQSVDGFIFPNFKQVITDVNFNPYQDQYRIVEFNVDYHSTQAYPNYYTIFVVHFITATDVDYTYQFHVYYNPYTTIDHLYNDNLDPIQTAPEDPAVYYNATDLYELGICFKGDTTNYNQWLETYNYLSDSNLDAFNNGFEAGYDAGNSSYYDAGYDAGYAQGQQNVNQSSYDAGYSAGMMDANGTNPYMNSIFSGIFQVGLLPVNVFLTMFNYEIFGINVSGLVSGLLTMSIIVIIFRFLFGGKSND